MAHTQTFTAAATGTEVTYERPQKFIQVEIEVTDADTSISAITVEMLSSINGTTDGNMTTLTFSAAELTALYKIWWAADKIFTRITPKVTTATGIGAGDSIKVTWITAE